MCCSHYHHNVFEARGRHHVARSHRVEQHAQPLPVFLVDWVRCGPHARSSHFLTDVYHRYPSRREIRKAIQCPVPLKGNSPPTTRLPDTSVYRFRIIHLPSSELAAAGGGTSRWNDCSGKQGVLGDVTCDDRTISSTQTQEQVYKSCLLHRILSYSKHRQLLTSRIHKMMPSV